VGKILHVDKGHRLSLQYHEHKDETSYLLSGRLLVVQGESVDSLTEREVDPGEAWHNNRPASPDGAGVGGGWARRGSPQTELRFGVRACRPAPRHRTIRLQGSTRRENCPGSFRGDGSMSLCCTHPRSVSWTPRWPRQRS
jgi:hypothetical protein